MKKNEFLREKPTPGNREQLTAGLNKLGAFIIIILGLWASSQKFAESVHFDAGWVGQPFYVLHLSFSHGEPYPLYFPWMYLWWCVSYWGRTEIHPFLSRSLSPLIICSIVSVVTYTIITYFRGFKQKAEKVFGTARWGVIRDLKKAGLLGTQGGIIIGQNEFFVYYVFYSSDI